MKVEWVLIMHIVFAGGNTDAPIMDTFVTYESCLSAKSIYQADWNWNGDREFAQLVKYECEPAVKGLKK